MEQPSDGIKLFKSIESVENAKVYTPYYYYYYYTKLYLITYILKQ